MLKFFLKIALMIWGICTCGILWASGQQAPILAFIATDDSGRDLYLFDTSTTLTLNLTNTPRDDEWFFAWSADGENLLYTATVDRERQAGDGLFLYHLRSGQQRRIVTEETLLAFGLTWSPDGSQIAYFSSHPRNVSDLYLIDVASGLVSALTRTPDISEDTPVWSPDGSQILFLQQNSLYILDIATGERQQYTPDAITIRLPVWSPDGRWVSMLAERGGRYSVLLLEIAQNQLTTIFEANIPAVRAGVWSPDSRMLLLSFGQDGYTAYDVLSGQVAWQIMSQGSGASWSPDGHLIAMLEDRALVFYDVVHLTRQMIATPLRMTPPLLWQP